jgi:hypothetical protein
MPTFTQIGSAVTVGSGGAASIEFTSIPSTYTDLVIKASIRANSADGSAPELSTLIKVNGSTAGSHRFIYGTGSGAFSSNNGSVIWTYTNGSTTTANTFGNLEIYIPNYAGTTAFKSYSVDAAVENNATAGSLTLDAGLVSNNAAITSFGLVANSGSFVQYSTAYLYGVSNA